MAGYTVANLALSIKSGATKASALEYRIIANKATHYRANILKVSKGAKIRN